MDTTYVWVLEMKTEGGQKVYTKYFSFLEDAKKYADDSVLWVHGDWEGPDMSKTRAVSMSSDDPGIQTLSMEIIL